MKKQLFFVLCLVLSVFSPCTATLPAFQAELNEQIRGAQSDLHEGECLYAGVVGERNYSHAVAFLLRAAGQNVDLLVRKKALVLLGQIYYYGGYGVTQDFVAAYDFLNAFTCYYQVVSQDVSVVERDLLATAYFYLAAIVSGGNEVITQNGTMAKQFLEKAFQLSSQVVMQVMALVRLGQLFFIGHETLPQDLWLAWGCFSIAHDLIQENPEVPAELKAEIYCARADIVRVGNPAHQVGKDYIQAVNWYITAYQMLQETDCELRYEVLLRAATLLFEGGYGLQRDVSRAQSYVQHVTEEANGDDLRRAKGFLLLGDISVELDDRQQAIDCYIAVLDLTMDEDSREFTLLSTQAEERLSVLVGNRSSETSGTGASARGA